MAVSAWAKAVRPISPNEDSGNIDPNERPVRGDNRTGQAIWALGVDGRSRRIQPRWGGITAPTFIGRGGDGKRSNRRRSFLTFWQVVFASKFIAPPADRPRPRP